MQRARAAILAHGGADAVNSYTRFYLALLGQISYEQCPAVPPEVVLLPKWFPANLYAVSSWSRTIIVPLSILSAFRPVRRLEPRLGIRELFLREPEDWPPLRCPGLRGGSGPLSWDRFFRTIDRLCKWCQRRRRVAAAAQGPGRGRTVDARPLRSERRPGGHLSADRLEHRGPEMPGLSRRQPRSAVLPPAVAGPGAGRRGAGTARLQPCKSPVWDTAITVRALAPAACGPTIRPCARRPTGCWRGRSSAAAIGPKRSHAEPGGWCFEWANDFYPDCDDTAMVLMALQTQFSGATAADEALPPELRLARVGPTLPQGDRRSCLSERSAPAAKVCLQMAAAPPWHPRPPG